MAGDERPLNVAILGSTGSVGKQALDVISQCPAKYRVVALTAQRNASLLSEQIAAFQPDFAALTDKEAAAQLQSTWGEKLTIGAGEDALVQAACWDGVDIVLVAVVGFAGLRPTLAALERGRRVALANKETLVVAGELVMQAAQHRNQLLPVDSEHAAVWQILDGRDTAHVEQIILTASGGPFRTTPAHRLADVTVAEALQHPTWDMGGKITIDSATLMNKGFEVIEAVRLFQVPLDRVNVLVHPQSLVHSLVEFTDGSMLAQLAVADMRLPIAYALAYPKQSARFVQRLDLAQLGTLQFEPPDTERFPALQLAIDACRIGGTMPAVLNAANEVAVEAFLSGRIGFVHISRLIADVMDAHDTQAVTLPAVFESDAWARRKAKEQLAALAR